MQPDYKTSKRPTSKNTTPTSDKTTPTRLPFGTTEQQTTATATTTRSIRTTDTTQTHQTETTPSPQAERLQMPASIARGKCLTFSAAVLLSTCINVFIYL